MKKAFIYIVFAGLLWGSSGIFVHFLEPFGFSSMQMTLGRELSAAIAMVAYIFFSNRKLFRASFGEIALYAMSGISMFLAAAFYYRAMQITSVSTAVVLMYTSPVFIMVYSIAFFGEKLTPMKTVAVVAMLVGCGLVSGIVSGFSINLVGFFYGIGAGLAYSMYNIVTKIEMRKQCDPKTATVYCFMFAAISALIVSKPWQAAEIIADHPVGGLLLVACGVCTCVIPYFIYTLALRAIPAGTAASLGIIEPMAATLYSVLFLGERLDIFAICGIVLILGSVLVLSREKPEKQQ
ncbi:MAG: EamA family transporter [Oscillospiraceae bacterium]|nr:EamA family transporter [Oscillospiraceae bacterium]